jgi:hypothetical protein
VEGGGSEFERAIDKAGIGIGQIGEEQERRWNFRETSKFRECKKK